eukprot:5626174-Pyramimonas_sp.AAC.1
MAGCPENADADATGAPAETEEAAGAADELALPDGFLSISRISKYWYPLTFGTAPGALDALRSAVHSASGCEA